MNTSPNLNKLTVMRKEQITPHLLRIHFSGEGINSNFEWKSGCYIKLLFSSEERTIMRSYTVRSIDAKQQSLIIDFSIHEPAGIGNLWVRNAKEGDTIEYKGPGQLKMNTHEGDWNLFAADLSALPAAISTLESLTPDAKGYAFFEVPSEEDKQQISIPQGIQVEWLVHQNITTKSTQQLEAIQRIQPLNGAPNVFVAGELSTIREIREYITTNEIYKNAALYISSYWKIGVDSEGHKLAKKEAN